MAGMIPFTNNYQDHSTDEGYQFEFFCERCGNGYSSTFKHSVVGFGGRIASIGGGLLGGDVGSRVENAGFTAQWLRSGDRSSTRDKQLNAAVEEMKPYFQQCHRCGQWVCKQICWNAERGLCVQCAPKLDQEVAALQASNQVDQINMRLQGMDLTQNVNITDTGTGLCPKCGAETGGGKFCQACGAPLAAAPAATKKFCANCGTELKGSKFCPECGTAAS